MSSDMSIKMIQSRASCRLVCPPRLLCKVINPDTLNCLGDKVGKQNLPVCNICNTSCSALFWGFVVSNITYTKHSSFLIQTEISNCHGDIIT